MKIALDERQLDNLFSEVSRHFAKRVDGVEAAISAAEATDIIPHAQSILDQESLLMQRLQAELLMGIYQELIAARDR